MDKILFVNACVRDGSRTKALADFLLDKLEGSIDEIKLDRSNAVPLFGDTLNERTSLTEQGDFDHALFNNARRFKDADVVVIAAPYWDLSFPAILKAYLESLCIVGLTFDYSTDGIPSSLCRARKLYFVTTAGGPVLSDEYGFGYIKKLCETFFGIRDYAYIKAEGLDMIGADIDSILAAAKDEINTLFEVK